MGSGIQEKGQMNQRLNTEEKRNCLIPGARMAVNFLFTRYGKSDRIMVLCLRKKGIITAPAMTGRPEIFYPDYYGNSADYKCSKLRESGTYRTRKALKTGAFQNRNFRKDDLFRDLIKTRITRVLRASGTSTSRYRNMENPAAIAVAGFCVGPSGGT